MEYGCTIKFVWWRGDRADNTHGEPYLGKFGFRAPCLADAEESLPTFLLVGQGEKITTGNKTFTFLPSHDRRPLPCRPTGGLQFQSAVAWCCWVATAAAVTPRGKKRIAPWSSPRRSAQTLPSLLPRCERLPLWSCYAVILKFFPRGAFSLLPVRCLERVTLELGLAPLEICRRKGNQGLLVRVSLLPPYDRRPSPRRDALLTATLPPRKAGALP